MIRLLQHGLVLRNPQSMEMLSKTSLVAMPITALLDRSYHKIKGFDFLQGFTLEPGAGPQTEWQKMPLIGLALAAYDEITLEFIKAQGISAIEIRKQWKLVQQLYPDSQWNYRAILATHPSQAAHDLFVMGSPQEVLHQSAWRLNERGESLFITSPARFKLEESLKELYGKGYELLGVAVKRHVQATSLNRDDVHELLWLGVLVTELKIDDSVPVSLHQLIEKGLKPVLVTDAPGTLAQALAYKAGLPSTASSMITGAAMRHMDDKSLQAQINHTSILAEVSSIDKQRLMRLWEASGQQVVLLSDSFDDVQVIGQVAMGMAMAGSALATQDAAQGILLHDGLREVATVLPVAGTLQAKWRWWLYIMAGVQVAEAVGCLLALWFNWDVLAPLNILTLNVVGVSLVAAILALF
jgi:magnesium-transporting ATPase (P-type)